MKILVATSNKYSFLIEPYVTLFNRHWPGQEIVFLGFEKGAQAISTLPNNCTFHALGKQDDFHGLWTDPLLPYMRAIEDDYFIFTVEDMMLMRPIDLEKMSILENEIRNKKADKALLDAHLNHHAEFHKENLVALRQDAPYRTTLHPAIWRKEYFLKYLRSGMTAWDFEVKNMPESKSDGATIISLQQGTNLFESANIYRKGVPIPRLDCKRPYGGDNVNMDDIAYIMKFINEQKEEQ